MKRFFKIFTVSILLLILSGAAHAYTINYLYTAAGNNYTDPYGVTMQTFDATAVGQLPAGWSGDGSVVNGSLTNYYAAPYGITGPDLTNYLATPIGVLGIGTLTFTSPSDTYNYLGLWWGSVDTYNAITFYLGASPVATITGSEAIDPSVANGNQTDPSTNRYINILDLPNFNSFQMTSTNYAFEADNIAVGTIPDPPVNTVPEPGTMLLLGLGLAGVAGVRRKVKK